MLSTLIFHIRSPTCMDVFKFIFQVSKDKGSGIILLLFIYVAVEVS